MLPIWHSQFFFKKILWEEIIWFLAERSFSQTLSLFYVIIPLFYASKDIGRCCWWSSSSWRSVGNKFLTFSCAIIYPRKMAVVRYRGDTQSWEIRPYKLPPFCNKDKWAMCTGKFRLHFFVLVRSINVLRTPERRTSYTCRVQSLSTLVRNKWTTPNSLLHEFSYTSKNCVSNHPSNKPCIGNIIEK